MLAVGPGKMKEDGTREEMTVKDGDTVLFAKYGANEVEFDGEKFLVLSLDEILAVIE